MAVARYASATPIPPSVLSRGIGWQVGNHFHFARFEVLLSFGNHKHNFFFLYSRELLSCWMDCLELLLDHQYLCKILLMHSALYLCR